MSNKPRNPDGTIRQTNKPRLLTNRSIVARWVEAETLHLKRLGMSYQEIADHIVAVVHGKRQAMVPIPEQAQFTQEYSVSAQAIHRAFHRGIARLPNTEAEAFRKLDTERCEDMFLSLQPGIRKGDPRSVEVGVKVLAHKAEINGYQAPARIEMTGKQGGPLEIETFRKLCEEAEGDAAEDNDTIDNIKTK
jgi:hypothetical protein